MAAVLNMPGLVIWQGCEYASVLQGAEYALIMPQYHEYGLIKLNMLEYACIYLNKQGSEYRRILNVSDAVDSIRSLRKLLRSYRERAYSEYCQTFKIERFAKRRKPKCKCATRHFSGQERFWATRALRQTFHQKHKKKRPHRETF